MIVNLLLLSIISVLLVALLWALEREEDYRPTRKQLRQWRRERLGRSNAGSW